VKISTEVSKTTILATDAATLHDAMYFVLEAADELGDEVDVEVKFRILPGEEGERSIYYGVTVRGTAVHPQEQGNDNE